MRNISCDLPDVNVWLALMDHCHAHHARAVRYWNDESAPKIAFCGVSLLGLFRLATQPKVMRGEPFLPAEIWQAYEKYRRLPEADFIREPSGLATQMSVWSNRNDFPVSGWTDCYLASVAHQSGCRLVSFDRDFSRFAGLDFLHLVP